MFEWYDLRMIDLYPRDDETKDVPAPPPGVIGEPPRHIAEDDLVTEEVSARVTRPGEHPEGD